MTAPSPISPELASPEPASLRGDARALTDLVVGECGVVAQVVASPAIAARLGDLGFLPGTRVEVRGQAPLGDPRIYELRGTRFCLRRPEAAAVQVIPERPSPGAS